MAESDPPPESAAPPPESGPGADPIRPVPLVPLRPAANEAEREARLAVMRRRATGLLVGALGVYLAARWFEGAYSWVGFIRATAEASVVGGLADWFAVTALFRHPLGLPIPHTAIIPNQKERIGRVLGNFFQSHFLDREVVSAEVRTLQLSERIARWMRDPENSRRIARQMAAGLATALEGIPEQEVRDIIRRNAIAGLEKTRVAPVIGNLLALVTSEGRHQALLDEVVRIVARALEQNRELIGSRVRERSPWWVPPVVDEALARRLIAALETLLTEIQADPRHPIRIKFDAAVTDYIEKLRTSPEAGAKAEALKTQLLNDAVTEEFIADLWASVRRSVSRYRPSAPQALPPATGGGEPGSDAAGTAPASAEPADDTGAPEALASALVAAGESLLANEAQRKEMDEFLTSLIAGAAEQHRQQVAELIARTIAGWDPAVASRRLELAIGSDLQYIRINGTLVGGLVGLLLHVLEVLF
jgi:uncharacterized membrane-anchored protein YjiN (DUF445 family)